MLFLSYWELNENISIQERLKFSQKLTSEGAFPPEGVNIIRWDVTSSGWGITVLEAENAIDAFKTIDMWRMKAGFFKTVKIAPALPVQEVMPQLGEFIQSLPQ